MKIIFNIFVIPNEGHHFHVIKPPKVSLDNSTFPAVFLVKKILYLMKAFKPK